MHVAGAASGDKSTLGSCEGFRFPDKPTRISLSLRCLQAENVARLEENAELTRAALRDNPTDSRLYAQLGTLMHHLDFISPNGGARIPEAEQAYL